MQATFPRLAPIRCPKYDAGWHPASRGDADQQGFNSLPFQSLQYRGRRGLRDAVKKVEERRAEQFGDGAIGSTSASGAENLGSSPSPRAKTKATSILFLE